MQPHARLACLLSTFTAIIKRTGWINQADYIRLHIELYFPWDIWKDLLPCPDKQERATSYAEFIHILEPLIPNLQQAMTKTFQESRRLLILNSNNLPAVCKGIILSQSHRGPSTLLTARWNKWADIRIPNNPFTALCQHRLCFPFFPGAEDRANPPIACSESVCRQWVDTYGVHLLQCFCGEHNVSNRHHEINRFLFAYLRKAGLAGSYEPNNLYLGHRPDFLFEDFQDNKRYIFDLTIPNLCNQQHLPTMLNHSVDNALLTDHNHKLNAPQNVFFGNMANSRFVPLVISATGTPHSLTLPILEHMAGLMSIKSGISYGVVLRTFFDTLYIRILRKTGLMIHSKFILGDPD